MLIEKKETALNPKLSKTNFGSFNAQMFRRRRRDQINIDEENKVREKKQKKYM
jgi:hypothetical protein